METTWILVADSTRARLFRAFMEQGNSRLEEIRDFSHPAGHMPGRDLETDAPGRTFDSAGPGRHAKEPPLPVKEEENIAFAHELGTMLSEEYRREAFKRLHLVAPPKFLSHLRKELAKGQVQHAIAGEADKNLTRHGTADILAALPALNPVH